MISTAADALFDELAAAEAAVNAHMDEYRNEPRGWENKTDACRRSWHCVYTRREAAVEALIEYAMARALG